MKRLAPRHEAFCKAYITTLNVTTSAVAAGYSKKTAASQGSRLLKKVKIAARIAKLQKKHCDKLEITADRVLRELALLAYANMDDYVDVYMNARGEQERRLNTAKPTRDQMAAVCEITEDTTGGSGDGERKAVMRTRFKLADKGINLERLGRHLKLFTDRIEMKIEGDLSTEILEARNAVQKLRAYADDRSRGA